MTKVIGVRFRRAGKIYDFDAGDFVLDPGMHVIVETARAVEYGLVCMPVREVDETTLAHPLKKVIRIASPEDDEVNRQNREKEITAFRICREKIKKHELEMKLVRVEYTFDNNKILFYFTADGRIDFRELVKDLAYVFKTRIELRQIGVRDETKMCGGIGICGRELCCGSYLSDFIPVSIKMAKEQNLSLNPTKISGVCGRLMCCLKNEEETYEYLNKNLPRTGDYVTLADGAEGEVHSVNVLRQNIKVLVTADGEEKELKEYPASDVKTRSRRKKEQASREGQKEDRSKGGLSEDKPEDRQQEPQPSQDLQAQQGLQTEPEDSDAAAGEPAERGRGTAADRRKGAKERPFRSERGQQNHRSGRKEHNFPGGRRLEKKDRDPEQAHRRGPGSRSRSGRSGDRRGHRDPRPSAPRADSRTGAEAGGSTVE